MNKKPVNVLTIRVPEELKNQLEKTAASQGVSLNQFALYAFTKELAELETSKYLKQYLKQKTKDDILRQFDNVMSRVQNRIVEDWDKV
jgi:hypothetical protein